MLRVHKQLLLGGACSAFLLALGSWYANAAASLESSEQQPAPVQVPSGQAPAEAAYDTVGPIEGEAISVQGPLNIEVLHGQTRTILRSGSDVRVNSGQAVVSLVEGGKIAICGPAHFSVLKSVNLLTIALDGGVMHAHIERTPLLTVYTAQLQLKPIPIGDGVQDLMIGFDPTGAMCVRPSSGALRIEQQLTAQNIVVPQGADIMIANAQLDALSAGNGRCVCDVEIAKAMPPPPELEISRPSTPEEIKKDAEAKAKSPQPAQVPPPAAGEPVYQVFMPPLSYDASKKVQRDDFDPKLIVFVRRVRVRPALIFQGRVEGDPVAPGAAPQLPRPAKVPKPLATDPVRKPPATLAPGAAPLKPRLQSNPSKSTGANLVPKPAAKPTPAAPISGAPTPAAPAAPATASPATTPAQAPKKPQSDSLMNRARNLWRKVFS